MTTILSLCLFAIVLTSCQKNSLQSYLVDHKSDDNFISVDFSLKTFVDNFDDLDPEQKEVFEDVNKVNFLAFKKNGSNDTSYIQKKEELLAILESEFEGNQLMSANMEGNLVKMYADNIEDTANEIVIYAGSDTRGFMLFRLLGDDLNPRNFYKMMTMSKDMNFESLTDMVDL